jgi:arylsulfatase A-like enzyme
MSAKRGQQGVRPADMLQAATLRSGVVEGVLAGGMAGLFLALADFGASWLWLPVWRDRLGLLLRLVATLTFPGALLGGALLSLALLAHRVAEAKTRAPRCWWPVPFTLAATLPLHQLAIKLCSGGSMARLGAHDALVIALSIALPVLLYGVFVLIGSLATWSHARRSRQRLLALISLIAAFGLGKLNQVFLPNLYDYLHATLAFVSWAVAALGSLSLLLYVRGSRKPRTGRLALGASLATAFALAAFLWSSATLDTHLNVRVAMFDARCPVSRALLSSLDPFLRRGDDSSRTHARAQLQRAEVDVTGLPTHPGAHIVLITVDALRADHLGSYGYDRPVSPEIDALSTRAVRFERAYAQAPHSSYSLSSLHTSEYLHELVELGKPLPQATLAKALRDAGYHTAAFFTDGIFHTEGAKLKQYRDDAFGFALFDHTNRESEDQTERVLREVDRIRKLGEPPSLLWVHYFDVHEPYQETTFGSSEMDRYDSEILHVDREVGKLIRALDERFEREVVVALTADHGEEFREHGGVYHGSTLYDEQVRVPLILRAPGLGASHVKQPSELIDVAPTLLGIVGVARPASMRGRDLRAAALQRTGNGSPVFSAVLTKRMAVAWPMKLIADLRFNLYELYDLEADPQERKNLADRERGKLEAMRSLIYAWLDSVESSNASQGGPDSNYARELGWGRLGDRRAVAPMTKLLLDVRAPLAQRIEAGQILARLADESAKSALVRGLQTKPAEVAAEAAIALGRMYDERARSALRKLVYAEDPFIRARAAISLGRLRDRAAVPALIEALWVAPTQYEREEAIRWLGRLRDPQAIEPLLAILPEFNLRYLAAVALGMIGDVRAYDALSDMLDWEQHMNIRDEVVRGLGLLGDKRAIPRLLEILARESSLKNTGESLIRLGALESGALGGVDLASPSSAKGISSCQAAPLDHDWNYLARTTCETSASTIVVSVPLPARSDPFPERAELIVRARRADAVEATTVTLRRGGAILGELVFDGEWRERRVEFSTGDEGRVDVSLTLAPDTRLILDHILIAPHSADAAEATAE